MASEHVDGVHAEDGRLNCSSGGRCTLCASQPCRSPSFVFVAEVPVHLALFWPMTGSWAGGRQIAGAAALAVERANADQNLLAVLTYNWTDSGCSAKQGLQALGQFLADKRIRVDAVIGPGCSSACEVTSHLAGGQGIPQISWGCTSPTLSDKNDYPLVRIRVHFFMLLASLVFAVFKNRGTGNRKGTSIDFADATSHVVTFSPAHKYCECLLHFGA